MKKKVDRSEVPVSAMIDVVFLLLVYFIVTSTAPVDEAFVKVNLPGPNPGPPTELVTLDVFVLEDKYVIQGRNMNLDEAGTYFKGVSQAMSDVTVNVKVDVKSSHQDLVLILDKLNEAKIEDFNLHTLK